MVKIAGGSLHYRIRIHFNNGYNPTTVPMITEPESIAQAQEEFENHIHRLESGNKLSHVAKMTLYSGRKRIAMRTFVDGKVQ